MSQKSSVPQAASFVSQTLKRNTINSRLFFGFGRLLGANNGFCRRDWWLFCRCGEIAKTAKALVG